MSLSSKLVVLTATCIQIACAGQSHQPVTLATDKAFDEPRDLVTKIEPLADDMPDEARDAVTLLKTTSDEEAASPKPAADAAPEVDPRKAVTLLKTSTDEDQDPSQQPNGDWTQSRWGYSERSLAGGWQPFVNAHGQGMVVSALLWACLLTCVAFYWKSNHPQKVHDSDKSAGDDDFKKWKVGLFECFNERDDYMYCLCGFFCPAIRWAETISYVPGLLTFWVAFAVFLGFTQLSQIFVYVLGTGGFIVGVAFLATLVYFRQQMRKKFDMDNTTVETFVLDTLAYCFCGCCAIIQEARHVEKAVESGKLVPEP